MFRFSVCILGPLMLLSLASGALAETITFKVRMQHPITSGVFDPDYDFVDLAGNFNGWGSSPLTPLADADGDSVYEITLHDFQEEIILEYKFRINGQWDGSEEFPKDGPNRVHNLELGWHDIIVQYGEVVPCEPDQSQLGWWNDCVFYEVSVRSFQDSGSDGIGDLIGLTQRLDYLNDGDPNTNTDLGVTGILLRNLNEDLTDFRAIALDCGILDDLHTFLDEAHARGIKVILEYVMNHCSDNHPWFQAAASGDRTYRDWFRWSNNNPGHVINDLGWPAWHPNESGYYFSSHHRFVADLNYETPAVKTEMFDTAAWWLVDVGVDGFCLDSVGNIYENGKQLFHTQATLDFWNEFNSHIKAIRPDALLMGESAWAENPSTTLKYATDDRLDICYEDHLSFKILEAVNIHTNWYLGQNVLNLYGKYPYLQFATYLTNPGHQRAFSCMREHVGRNKAAAGIYLALPGVPFLRYGEEIGMNGTWDDENTSSPMQWTNGPHAGFTTGSPWHPINGDFLQKNVAEMKQDPNSLWSWYQNLVDNRLASQALCRGEYLPLKCSDDDVFAFLRRHGEETVLCLVNLSKATLNGLSVVGTSSPFPSASVDLINLLDENDTLTVTVSEGHTIEGLSLDPKEAAWYRFRI